MDQGDDGDPSKTVTPIGQLSYFSVARPEQRRYKKHDLVTIVINEDSTSTTTGKSTSKKDQTFDAALQQFIKFGSDGNGLPTAGKITNPAGLPEAAFKFENDRPTTLSKIAPTAFPPALPRKSLI